MQRMVLACLVVLGLLGPVAPAHAAEAQWQRDGNLVAQVVGEVRSGGLGAVGPHAGAMKKALAGATKLFPGPNSADGASYLLTDGAAETAAALVAVASRGKGDVVAVDNPYPVIGLMLGSFYVETGKFKDALKALDAGLALSPLPKDRLGVTVPDLLSERGIALGQLKRWKEALATYDSGLALRTMEKGQRALLQRGRGFVLVELGRLEEAEAAYKASLKLEPGNALAKNELAYIASLQKGAKPINPSLTVPGANKK